MRFSLRTLLLGVTVVCGMFACLAGGIRLGVQWERDRRDTLDKISRKYSFDAREVAIRSSTGLWYLPLFTTPPNIPKPQEAP